jgi:hypothetical protein
MPVNTYHLRSSIKGKEPTAGNNAGQLPIGSIAINFNSDEPFLAIQDANGVVRRIAGVKIDATAPASPTAGEWWVDTSGATKIVKVFDGTAWVATGSPVVDATTGVKGIAQLADAAAVTAGTTGRVVTADQLKATNDAVAANTTNITTINGKVADATTGAKGIVQLADAAAVTAGTVGRVVTADQLKATNDAVATATAGGISTINGTAPVSVTGTGSTRTVAVADATDAAKGVVELADAAETTAGTDVTRAVTPAGLKVELDKKLGEAPNGTADGTKTYVRQVVTSGTTNTKTWVETPAGSAPPSDASTTVKGIVQLATAAETTTGTDATKAVHPAGLKVELDKKAPLASPTFTGTPAGPTATAGTATTQLATTAFVDASFLKKNISTLPALP